MRDAMTETIDAGLAELALVRLRRDIDAELDRRALAAEMLREGISSGSGFVILGPRPPPPPPAPRERIPSGAGCANLGPQPPLPPPLPREGILSGYGFGFLRRRPPPPRPSPELIVTP